MVGERVPGSWGGRTEGLGSHGPQWGVGLIECEPWGWRLRIDEDEQGVRMSFR